MGLYRFRSPARPKATTRWVQRRVSSPSPSPWYFAVLLRIDEPQRGGHSGRMKSVGDRLPDTLLPSDHPPAEAMQPPDEPLPDGLVVVVVVKRDCPTCQAGGAGARRARAAYPVDGLVPGRSGLPDGGVRGGR